MSLVPTVDRDQVRGQRLDLVRVAQPTGVHPAHSGDGIGQSAHQVGRVAMLALPQHQDVGVDRRDLRVVEHDGADVVERSDHDRVRQQRRRLLGRRAVGHLEREAALLVETDRVHAVDHDLAGEGLGERSQQLGVPVVRHRDDHDVRGRGRIGVAETLDVAARGLGQLGGDLAGAFRVPAADHGRDAGRRPTAYEPTALRPGAPEDGDGDPVEVGHQIVVRWKFWKERDGVGPRWPW
jgi:hypothetical protein